MSRKRVYEFLPLSSWIRFPRKCKLGEIPAVAVDRKDRLIVYQRGTPPVMIFDSRGRFVRSFGNHRLIDGHGISLDGEGKIWCVDRGTHCVRKFDSQGRLLLSLNPSCQPGNPERPFRLPTGVASSPDGSIFVSDGYANARVHKFSPSGRLLKSWGNTGAGKGQFNLPHGIAVDRSGRVYVCDRENHRIQIFDEEGRWKESWTGFNRPSTVFIAPDGTLYIAEMGHHVSILDPKGRLIGELGSGSSSGRAGNFFASPHGVCMDSQGSLYVSEVAFDKTPEQLAAHPARIHKFKRVA